MALDDVDTHTIYLSFAVAHMLKQPQEISEGLSSRVLRWLGYEHSELCSDDMDAFLKRNRKALRTELIELECCLLFFSQKTHGPIMVQHVFLLASIRG